VFTYVSVAVSLRLNCAMLSRVATSLPSPSICAWTPIIQRRIIELERVYEVIQPGIEGHSLQTQAAEKCEVMSASAVSAVSYQSLLCKSLLCLVRGSWKTRRWVPTLHLLVV
jgi:hypothetical protein